MPCNSRNLTRYLQRRLILVLMVTVVETLTLRVGRLTTLTVLRLVAIFFLPCLRGGLSQSNAPVSIQTLFFGTFGSDCLNDSRSWATLCSFFLHEASGDCASRNLLCACHESFPPKSLFENSRYDLKNVV